jgi:hypothetical protein
MFGQVYDVESCINTDFEVLAASKPPFFLPVLCGSVQYVTLQKNEKNNTFLFAFQCFFG